MDYYNEGEPELEGAVGGVKGEPVEPKEEGEEGVPDQGNEVEVDSSMPSFSLSDTSWVQELLLPDPDTDPSIPEQDNEVEFNVLIPERLGQSHFGKHLNEWNKANLKPAYDDYR